MKSGILLFVFVLSSVFGFGQTADTTHAVQNRDKIACIFPVMPELIYPGGFFAYMKDSIKYPEEEKKKGIQGVVYISFMVEVDGSVTNVKEAKGVAGGPGLTKECIRVFSSMPKWKPCIEDGKVVRMPMTQPVRFVLSDSTEKVEKEKFQVCGPQIPEDSLGTIFNFAERMPEYPGGWNAYLVNNLKAPANADATCTTVYVTFIVLENGHLANVQIKNDGPENCAGLQQAVLDVFCGMPPWQPGAFNNNPVKCRMTIPVRVEWQR